MMIRKDCIYSIVCFCLLAGGLPALAANKSVCRDGSYITQHDDGSLRDCTLKDSYFINGVTCKDSNIIRFYDTGDLESCTLAESVTIGDTTCQADGQITFYMDGKLRQCVKYQ